MDRTLGITQLLQPIKVGGVKLKNRIVMAPMGTAFAENGRILQQSVDYYSARAKGGVGLIITEAMYVHPFGIGSFGVPYIYHDRFIPGLKELADAVHGYGAKIGAQLNFIGLPQGTGMHALPAPNTIGNKARGLAIEEIRIIASAFGKAAQRARTSGFDLVEIHCCHGCLLTLFLSPYYNRRVDEYGGEKGRTRIASDILTAIKENAGADFPVIFRINGDDSIGERGVTPGVAQANAKMIEEAGAAAIDVSSGLEFKSAASAFLPIGMTPDYRWDLANCVKKAVTIPVIASGGLTDPRMAEKLLQDGKADLIGFGRSLLADPDFILKATAERYDDIRPCIRCCQGCLGNFFEKRGITCLCNPELGHEWEFAIKPATQAKKVLVIGGGPGGLEAAVVAAKQGHKVILFEKQQELGGQFRLAAVPPGKSEIRNLISYFQKKANKLGIELHLGEEATKQSVEVLKPDVIIIASGSVPSIPPIPGINSTNVFTAVDVLDGKVRIGDEVIVIGGGTVGCETASFLTEQGKKVTVVEMADEFCRDLNHLRRDYLLKELSEKGIKMVPHTMVKEITPQGVITLKGPFGAMPEEFIKGNTVVLATGVEENRDMVEKFKGKAKEVYVIGDSLQPRTALEAIHDGFHSARKIGSIIAR